MTVNNQIILVNKKSGITSRDVVNELCHILKTKKIGHTGTLDPLAEGVLVIVVNEATKLCELLTSSYKEYIAQIKLGIKTDTQDITGNIIDRKPVQEYTKEEISDVLNSFVGTSSQTVPIYSAIKVKGKKLYEYARNNESVELPTRKINITNIDLIEYEKDLITFKVTVSKGTYIRSLIEDIAQKLDTIGTMNSLIRTKQGKFNLKDCYTLDQIRQGDYKSFSIKDALGDLLQITIDEKQYNQIKNGSIIDKTYKDDQVVFIYNDQVVAIYQTYSKDKNKMKPYKMFHLN